MTSLLCEAGVWAVPLIKSKYQQNQRIMGSEGGRVQSEFKVEGAMEGPAGTHMPYVHL